MSRVYLFHRALLEGDFETFRCGFDPNGIYEHVELFGGVMLWSGSVAAACADDLARQWVGGTIERQLHTWKAVGSPGRVGAVAGAASCARVELDYSGVTLASNLRVHRTVQGWVWADAARAVLRLETSHNV